MDTPSSADGLEGCRSAEVTTDKAGTGGSTRARSDPRGLARGKMEAVVTNILEDGKGRTGGRKPGRTEVAGRGIEIPREETRHNSGKVA